LPAELVAVDAFLDDERFIAPWQVLFSKRLGRPSVPVDTLLRLLYLLHRHQLGYERLCREVSDSIGWRGSAACRWTGRCRTRPRWSSRSAAPAPRWSTSWTLLWWQACQGKLLRAHKLRVDTTVAEADRFSSRSSSAD
jgi:transposase, IS5 family